MEHQLNKQHIGLDAIVFAIYLGLSPIHQVLKLASGGTLTKYLALVVMVIIVVKEVFTNGTFTLNKTLANSIGLIAGWFAITTLWSVYRFSTISSLRSIFSYFALMLIVCSKEWSDREKSLFKIVLTVCCIYYSYTLIQSVGDVRRSTFVLESTGAEADQNVLAMNIGLAIILSLDYIFKEKRFLLRFLAVIADFFMLIGVVCTGSRGGVLSILAASGFYMFKMFGNSTSNKLKIIFISLVAIILAYCVLTLNILGNESIVSRFSGEGVKDTSGRTEIWSEYFKMLINKPFRIFVGYGYGEAGYVYKRYFGTNYPPATHNDYLQIICDAGIVGLGFVLNFVNKVRKKSLLYGDVVGRACMVLMLVGSLSVNIFNRYGWWNAMIFAFICIGSKEADNYAT